jgi:hypothetical protein
MGMDKSERVGEAVEAALDGAIKNIVAHPDAEAAEQGRSDLILDHQVRAVLLG